MSTMREKIAKTIESRLDTDGTGEQLAESILAVVAEQYQQRLDVYVQKHAEANPLGDDLYSRHGALQYVIEALCISAHHCGLKVNEPEWLDDTL